MITLSADAKQNIALVIWKLILQKHHHPILELQWDLERKQSGYYDRAPQSASGPCFTLQKIRDYGVLLVLRHLTTLRHSNDLANCNGKAMYGFHTAILNSQG